MSFNDLMFIRKGELIVGPKVSGTNAPVEPASARVFKTRIKFSIGQKENSDANKAKISIYNLSKESRTFLEQDNLVCFLNTGYGSQELENLFFGDVNRYYEQRTGPDILSNLECGDAENVLQDAFINISLGPGATNIQIINQAVAKLKVSLGLRGDIKTLTFQGSYAYSGTVKNLLNLAGKQAGFKWSIQNGELLILGPNQTDGQTAIVLSKETGLIGYPTKTKDGFEFISLLNPKIRPGRAVRLESANILDGQGANLKVTKTSFTGDTSEGLWQVKCEGVPEE